ncbi:hypothetical protein BFJ70_g7569 [Fusarium oxysporum]|nr:hypothetical protein BFJ70_g7569 [Fusarium oxysporum]
MEKKKKGGLMREEWARVLTFQRNAIKRAEEESMERAMDAQRWLEGNKSTAPHPIPKEDAKIRRLVSESFRALHEACGISPDEPAEHYDNDTNSDCSWTDQLTPGSSQGSSVHKVSSWW